MRKDMVERTVDMLTKFGAYEGAAPNFEDVVDVSFAPLWDAYKK